MPAISDAAIDYITNPTGLQGFGAAKTSIVLDIFRAEDIDPGAEPDAVPKLLAPEVIPEKEQRCVPLLLQILGDGEIHAAGADQLPDTLIDIVADHMDQPSTAAQQPETLRLAM